MSAAEKARGWSSSSSGSSTATSLDAVDALYPGLLGEFLAEAIEPSCPATLREAKQKHIERTRAHLATLTVLTEGGRLMARRIRGDRR
jgi:hypothetical protein